jgi:hypothetical protein
MASSGMLRCVAVVSSDVSEELNASIIRVTRFDELVTTLAVTTNRHRLLVTANVAPSSPILATLMIEALSSPETSVHTTATLRNNQEDAILHCHRRDKLKSYILNSLFTIKFPHLSSV